MKYKKQQQKHHVSSRERMTTSQKRHHDRRQFFSATTEIKGYQRITVFRSRKCCCFHMHLPFQTHHTEGNRQRIKYPQTGYFILNPRKTSILRGLHNNT